MNILTSYEFFKCILPEQFKGYDFRTIEEYFDINGIDENLCSNTVHEYAMSEYIRANWQWYGIRERPMTGHICYIEESLKTHPAESLIKKIRAEFKNEIKNCAFDNAYNQSINDIIRIELKQNNNLADMSCINDNKLLKNAIAEKFYDIIEKWLYKITIILVSNKSIDIYLEPVYTKCITEDIMKNGGIGYHITKIENEKSICKNGLRPKVGKTPKEAFAKNTDIGRSNKKIKKHINGYRYFPERTYIIGNGKTRKDTITALESAVFMKNYKQGEYAIIIIDFNKHNVDLWEDRAAPEIKYAAYTHTFIPDYMIIGVVYNPKDI